MNQIDNSLDTREVIINVDHLTKDYGSKRGVFDVSIKVHKGECYGYLGPNGAGKSTTIRHLMGFSKPQKGVTQIHGIDTFGHTDEILGKVGYLPGEPSLPQGLTGWEFLRMMQDMRNERNDERLKYLINLFKLDPSPNVKSMSLGDKRKLAVVAAFMNDPDVLVLDEPTSGLDPVMQQVFIKFVVEEKKRGKTILLSSHIFSEVEATCDVISIIKDGKHVSTFKTEDIGESTHKVYVLQMRDVDNYNKYIEKCPFEIVQKNEHRLSVMVKFESNQYKEFTESVQGIKINAFLEKPFTLQDYFMSFYKEDREFGGLSGVLDNQEGRAK